MLSVFANRQSRCARPSGDHFDSSAQPNSAAWRPETTTNVVLCQRHIIERGLLRRRAGQSASFYGERLARFET